MIFYTPSFSLYIGISGNVLNTGSKTITMHDIVIGLVINILEFGLSVEKTTSLI